VKEQAVRAEPGSFPADAAELVRREIERDLGPGDATSEALIDPARAAVGRIVAREACRVSGVPAARLAFACLDPDVSFDERLRDGEDAAPGDVLAEVRCRARALLGAERTALNLLQRMSGIATATRAYAEIARPFGVDILDTRKTLPGMRALEKYAVRCGGGVNHRMGLFDMAMIKDNHRALAADAGRSLADAVRAVRAAAPGMPVEVEVETEDELGDALRAAPDWILLDNMAPDRMRVCVERIGGRCRVEASGGIDLHTLEAAARTGVDAISVGALTHSARAVDLSLEVVLDES
jgi:nicotinate-nucleotide pyrophosphorylase (carboxylating)